MPDPDVFRNSFLLLQQQQRAAFTRLIEQTEAALAADWQRGPAIIAQYYAPLIDEYAKALADLRLAEDNPAATLSLDWLTSRNAQLNQIEQSVRYSLDQYGHDAQAAVTAAQAASIDQGLSDAAQLTQRSLWPAVEGAGVPPAMLFNRPNPDAMAAWVGRSGNGHPLGDLFANFGAEAASSARKEMLLGLALGANPRAMAQGIANALGISRSRATIIARTEVLGSYRAAQMETYRANSDVVSGWLWSAGGPNPCAACMGMDGLQFTLEEELIDHPCGACAALPITRSWDDILSPLGIDASGMDETSIGEEDAYFGGEDRFNAMTPAQQRAVIGTNTGYEAWRRGEVSLRDFAGRRADGMIYQRSLRELQIPTRQGRTLVEPSPAIRGSHRASARGQLTPLEQMPAWARQSEASRNVYQILRNGLPYDLMSHEQGLLITNLEQMLREELPVNVRAAVERQLQMMGQAVERTTIGQATRDIEQTASREAIQAAEADIKTELGRELTHISPDEIAAWTANNADGVPSIAYHASEDAAHIERLQSEGVDLRQVAQFSNENGRIKGLFMSYERFDQGDFAGIYGSNYVALAVRMENPLVIGSADEAKAVADEVIKTIPADQLTTAARNGIGPVYQEAFRAWLDDHGYDGMLYKMFNTGDHNVDWEIVAFKPGTVRVVERQTVGQAAQSVEEVVAQQTVAKTAEEVATTAIHEAPFGTVDEIVAQQQALEDLYKIPMGDPTTMEKEHPEWATIGGENMEKMLGNLAAELNNDGAFMRLARYFGYGQDDIEANFVSWENAKRYVESGATYLEKYPKDLAEQQMLAAMSRDEAQAWAKDRALQGAIYNMLERYHSVPEAAIEDITKWNADPFQIAVLEAAKAEFGLGKLTHDYYTAEDVAKAMQEYGSYKNGIRSLVRQMQADTQRIFEEQGIKEVQVFRGVRWVEGDQPAGVAWGEGMTANPLTAQPLSSWASNAEIAFDYATGTGKNFFITESPDYSMVLVSNVPVDRVVSYYATGLGSEPLREMLLLSGDYDVYAVPFKPGSISSVDDFFRLIASQGRH